LWRRRTPLFDKPKKIIPKKYNMFGINLEEEKYFEKKTNSDDDETILSEASLYLECSVVSSDYDSVSQPSFEFDYFSHESCWR
jgi:hypothetical protein